ncbi:uncharacterized protein [Fopius arisanus]|uniref:Uncharacterized protein isoform X2 n=1 Tax=Fopius arisanus TaxID=64838 RepID=A0A9R1SVT1_9HYME|nr:PREDICTED: uncharacterized protein LOC105263475 isoform X2 [Fopius arisanus]
MLVQPPIVIKAGENCCSRTTIMESFSTPRYETKIETFDTLSTPISQRQVTSNVVEPALIHIEDNHGNNEQGDGHEGDSNIQVTEIQSNIQHSMTLTPVRLPAILDGEYFSVIRIDDSNVTVRCLQCQKLLNGNLKSTGNFLSHIKRVHPVLIDKIKTKSHQRKPALAYIDTTPGKFPEPVKSTKGYRKCYRTYSQDDNPSNPEENCEPPPVTWSETSPPVKKKKSDEPEHQDVARPHQSNFGTDDEFDAIGRNVAAKLRNMRLDQRIIAEKLLNDVLFEAQLGTLHRAASLHV